MTASLTPDLALRYLDLLAFDLRGAVVLGAGGERLAGAEALAGPVRDLVAALKANSAARWEVDGALAVAARGGEAVAAAARRMVAAAATSPNSANPARGRRSGPPGIRDRC